MSNFSIENIGAFELNVVGLNAGELGAPPDGALEAAAAAMANPSFQMICATTQGPMCRRMDANEIADSAVEASGTMAAANPTVSAFSCGTRPIRSPRDVFNDDALEAAAASLMAGPTETSSCLPPGYWTRPPMCRRINDDTLEASAGYAASPTMPAGGCMMTNPVMCRRIDDAALEGAAWAGPTQTLPLQCGLPPNFTRTSCGRIEDGALEASAAMAAVPTSAPHLCQARTRYVGCGTLGDSVLEASANPGNPTARGWTGFCCGRIDANLVDDAALEAAPVNPLPPTVVCPRHIDDGALENAAMMAAQPSINMGCSSTFGRMCNRIDADDGEVRLDAADRGMTDRPQLA